MRTTWCSILGVTGVAIASAVGACSPYSPSLSKDPFLCGSSAPVCPSGYSCMMNSDNESVCVENGATSPDGGSDQCAADTATALMNSTIGTAWVTTVDTNGTMNMKVYSGLSICPQPQFFQFTVTPAMEAFRGVVSYESWGVPLQATLMTTSGTPIQQFGAASGSADTIKAVVASIAGGGSKYIIEVQAGSSSGSSSENNYSLEIDLCASTSSPPCNM